MQHNADNKKTDQGDQRFFTLEGRVLDKIKNNLGIATTSDLKWKKTRQ